MDNCHKDWRLDEKEINEMLARFDIEKRTFT
jgi:hypothetical protein